MTATSSSLGLVRSRLVGTGRLEVAPVVPGAPSAPWGRCARARCPGHSTNEAVGPWTTEACRAWVSAERAGG